MVAATGFLCTAFVVGFVGLLVGILAGARARHNLIETIGTERARRKQAEDALVLARRDVALVNEMIVRAESARSVAEVVAFGVDR